MHDRVTISAGTLTVEAGKGKLKFEDCFLWVLIPLCAVFSVTVYRHVDSPVKYLLILFLLAVIPYYKFVYLKFSRPAQGDSARKLSVSGSKLSYFNGMYTYVIPLSGIAAIEDRSRFHDFRGRNEKGWSHLFVIRLRDDCNVLRLSSSAETCLKGKAVSQVSVHSLVLKHEDYEKVLAFLHQCLV